MAKISIILATFNEEKNIQGCLESIRPSTGGLADEIVIVDGSSTDKTVKIARRYTKKILIRENPLMFHRNKQLAIDKASGDWILYLDADERVTSGLKKEILSAISNPKYAGFWIPRKNIIFGKWIKNSFWWPDYQLRLFRKGKAFLPCKSVHEQPKLDGKAGFLKEPLLHFNYRTVSQYLTKLNNLYTENDKNIYLKEDKKADWTEAIRLPAEEFSATFFAREAYQDGLHGLILSLLQAFSSLVTFAKVWEARGFKEETDKFIEKTESEFEKTVRNYRYWFLTSKIKRTSNFWQKAWLRLKRKLI